MPSTSGAGVQLDAPGAVVEVEERGLALAAAGVQAAGDADAHVGLLAGFESFVRRLGLGDRRHARVGVRERVDARLPQRLELAAAGGEELEDSSPPRLRDFDLGDGQLALLAARERAP